MATATATATATADLRPARLRLRDAGRRASEEGVQVESDAVSLARFRLVSMLRNPSFSSYGYGYRVLSR